jgi:predicted esterase YcpF (UPF0227 family)
VLVYIHGFNSSPRSYKARLLETSLAQAGRAGQFLCPALSHDPRAAMQTLEAVVAANPRAALVGSSLGGYYATVLSEKHGLRAVLVNPAVRPYELLAGETGPQKNLYTGEKYEFTAAHVAALRALETGAITPSRYLLMVQTGDEVLDYRQAVDRYRGCRQLVIEGGDHGFSDFEKYLVGVLEFCGTDA